MNYAETYPDEMTDYEFFCWLDPAEIQHYQEILDNDSEAELNLNLPTNRSDGAPGHPERLI